MKKIEYILFGTIVAISIVVRLYKIDSPIADWHSWRQSATASVSQIFVDEGIDVLYPRYYDISSAQTGYYNPEGLWFVELPAFSVIHAGLFRFFPFIGFTELGRIISILSSAISVIFIILLGKRFISTSGGLVAGAFFAILPYNIYFGRVLLPEPLAVVFGLSALYFFSKYIDSSRWKFLLFSSALFAVSLLVKPFTIFYAVPILYLAWTRGKNGGMNIFRDKRLWMYGLVVLSPLVLWRLWMSQFPEGIPHTKWAFNGDGIRFRPAFWRWMFGERLGQMFLGIWGVVIFAFGLVSRKTHGFILSFLLGSFLFVATFATANVRHDYYQIIIIPSIVLALSSGALVMWNPPKGIREIYSRLVLVFSIVMMLGMSWYQIREFYNINRIEIVRAGESADRLLPEDALVIAPYNKDMAFLYHTKRFGWPFVDGSVEEMIEKGADYWVAVNFDEQTVDLMKRYEIVDQTQSYVIIDLGNPKEIQK